MHRQYKLRRLSQFTSLLVIVLFLSQCKSKDKKENAAPKAAGPVVVDVIIAQTAPVSNIIEASGSVLASEYVELRPEVSGRLTYLNLVEGKPVTKGTVIARVNDADLRAQIIKSKSQLALAEKTVERYKQLLDINGLNQADYDLAVSDVNTYKSDIAYSEALIDKTVIRAPFSGVIGLRQVSPGAFVTPTTLLATLQQTTQVKIDFTIPEIYSNVIKNGMTVQVELDAVSKQRTDATIVAVEPGANTDTRNLKIRATLKGSLTNPGAFVKVYIDAGKGKSAVKVPTNCIIPDDRNNQVILVKNGTANFVNIQTGIREDNTVEVVKGVNVGDTVVVTGVLFARPKSKVKVRSVQTLDAIINNKDSSSVPTDTL